MSTKLAKDVDQLKSENQSLRQQRTKMISDLENAKGANKEAKGGIESLKDKLAKALKRNEGLINQNKDLTLECKSKKKALKQAQECGKWHYC